jgi:hypothetical protein
VRSTNQVNLELLSLDASRAEPGDLTIPITPDFALLYPGISCQPAISFRKLREEAGRLGILLEQLASAVVSDLLATQDNDVRAAVDHVLRKDEELYHRLS